MGSLETFAGFTGLKVDFAVDVIRSDFRFLGRGRGGAVVLLGLSYLSGLHGLKSGQTQALRT